MKTEIQHVLEPQEQGYIQDHFRLTTTESANRRGSVKALDLTDSQKIIAYLNEISGLFRAPSSLITASQFAKRYSYLSALPSLYTMTMYNKGLNPSLENSYVESAYKGDRWLPGLRLADITVTRPDEKNRRAWRDDIIQTLFADNLTQVWRSLTKATHVPSTILWENTAVYVFWLYETKMKETTDHEQRQRMRQDFFYIIHQAPGTLFGEKENPLSRFYGPKYEASHTEQPVRFRRTCCFSFRLPDSKGYCKTCSKMKHCQKGPASPETW